MRARVLMLLLLLCAACRVGEPLVGEKKFAPGDLHFTCGTPPTCNGPWQPEDPPDHPAQALQGCASPKLCNGFNEQLGVGVCPSEKLETLPLSAACQELELLADNDAEDVRLDGLDWKEVNLTFRTEQAISVLTNGGTLARVHMQLEGPVALHIEHLETLADLRIQGAANSGGAPSVSFDDVHGKVLSIGTPDRPFPGSISMHALMLTDIDVRAQRSNFESVNLDQASLRFDALTFTDVTLSHVLLESSEAIVSAYDVADSVLHFCGDVRFIDGNIVRSELSSCLDHPLRLYTTKFYSGLIDGGIELDDTTITGSRVGSRDSTRILAYNAHFEVAQLCENLEQLALGRASEIRCSDCNDGTGDDEQLCALDELKDALSGNYCPAWQDIDQPTSCGGDLPTRPNRLR